MGFGALRYITRPLSRTLISRTSTSTATLLAAVAAGSPSPKSELRSIIGASFGHQAPWFPISSHFHSLTDTRFPKRRPSDKPGRKRGSLRPPGPYKLVPYVPGEPIAAKPNEGSVKRRNAKKRIRQRLAFILAEKKKRKAQMQEAKRKKNIKRIERKMAAVARGREWAQRLAELHRLEEGKKSMA
ncbi:uncharacterized protein LOC112094166 [Morus notabilis]|uniref:uncharacterized protein LOC112094166 n=1 Tax=Morus notabilis TaxID=981085 RepID=UPI000CED0483|nr:uncharacterized protein LOC112094166 [Morus notabilis]